ncbi:MAG: hypothetical protein WCX73_01900 [Candidatus Pacearchaeota archaeon]
MSENLKKLNGKKESKVRIFSLVLTAFILGLLIISSPANAFTLTLTSNDNKVEKGDVIVFTATVDVNSETDEIQNLTLDLEGPEDQTCIFNTNGVILSGCKGISITKLESAVYGYGYGYGYMYSAGKFQYRIRLDTDKYKTGTYSTKLIIKTTSQTLSKDSDDIKIMKDDDDDDDDDDDSDCTTLWMCSAWSSCVDGTQIRSCYKEDYACDSSLSKPIEERTCSVQSNAPIVLKNEKSTSINEKTILTNKKQLNQNSFSQISNAVTGTLGNPGWIILPILVFGIMGFLIAILVIRLRPVRRKIPQTHIY